MHYEIRDLTNPFEIEKLEKVQQLAWGFDDRDTTPGSMLTVAAHTGGVVAAAYAPENPEPVGFVYGFPAVRNGKLLHHSHMLAIVPTHRGSGLASALKMHQRKLVLAMGQDTMQWTMDSLLAKNARLNLGKLGARAVVYYQNWYADSGGMYAGLPADRFLVEWDLQTEPQEKIIPEINASKVTTAFVFGQEPKMGLEEPKIYVEVPRDINEVKRTDMPAARAWRAAHRLVFEHYFARGYSSTDLVQAEDGRVFYELIGEPRFG